MEPTVESDLRRENLTEVELYMHYRKQLSTLNHDLAKLLYHTTRKTNSLASTPCVSLIIAYLELPADYNEYYDCEYTFVDSVEEIAPPIDLLKRKAMALLGWRIDRWEVVTRKANDEIVPRYPRINIYVVPPDPNDTRVAIVQAYGFVDTTGKYIPIPDSNDSESAKDQAKQILAGLYLYCAYAPQAAYDEDDFGFLLGNDARIEDIYSITFSSNAVESSVDVPGQVAPYGACGEIPGVAHFYPELPPCAPYDELVAVAQPTAAGWKRHRGKRQPSARLAEKQAVAKETFDAAKATWFASLASLGDSVDFDYFDFDRFAPRSTKRRKTRK